MLVIPKLDNHRSWSDAANDPRADADSREALAGLRGLLGDRWSGWADAAPLACQFFVRVQGAVSEGVRLWTMVQGLRGTAGLEYFVSDGLRKKAWPEYTATVMALEFCSRLRSRGSEVEFIQRDHDKSPDARVRLVTRCVTIEFKGLHDSDEMEPWNDFEQTVMDGLSRLRLGGAAFDRELTPVALLDPAAVVEGLASIAEHRLRDYVDLPRGTGRARLAEGNVGRCGYPVEQKDELLRLTSKIRSKDWRTQLEGVDGPTLLVVRTNTLFDQRDPESVGRAARRIANALQPHIRNLKMFGAVLVYEEPFWAPILPSYVNLDDLRIRMDTSPVRCARFMALLENRDATTRLSEAELNCLVGPEPNW